MTSVIVTKRNAALAAAILAALGASNAAYAVGTDAGVVVSNTATVSFSVGTVAQTPVVSNTDQFTVDKRVLFSLAQGAAVPTLVDPGQVNQAVAFNFQNTTNGSSTFNFAALNEANGVSTTVGGTPYVDNSNLNNVRIFRENDAVAGYSAGDLLVSGALAFAEDETETFYIVADVPGTAANNALANLRLTATTTDTNTAGGDNKNGLDTVLADAGGDGIEASAMVFRVQSAALAVVKDSVVVSDPFNGVSVNAKRIPGAVIRYSIAITNTGTRAALGVAISDPLAAELKPLGTDTFYNVSYTGAAPGSCVAEVAGGDANSDGCVVTAGALVVNPGGTGFTVPSAGPGSTTTVTVSVEVR